ncbi:unnamed protein product, partial [Brassica oleracea var. botrytis]
MKDEEGFYYPHNPDFRSRAYPMHPHLNHLSSDLRRGTLEFAEGRPLGIIPCCCCLRCKNNVLCRMSSFLFWLILCFEHSCTLFNHHSLF